MRSTADQYVEIMREVVKKGDGFLDNEVEKIDKILLSKNDEKLSKKRNIFQHFRSFRRDEL